jgi:hypothetical protein
MQVPLRTRVFVAQRQDPVAACIGGGPRAGVRSAQDFVQFLPCPRD